MWQQILLTALPLVVTLVLTIIIPLALSKRTHDLAVFGLLHGEHDPMKEDILDYILGWRDLITAIISALFVVEFSVAAKIVEKITAPGIHVIDWSIVIIVALVLVLPLLIISIWLLSESLEPRTLRNKSKYWLLFMLLVVPWYMISFAISYFL